ncbi:MAG: DUF2378 family protein [Deltaproteobacteria bacterium]|nr:DUF2378 family protein [Deltaproteobacteria bacterium]
MSMLDTSAAAARTFDAKLVEALFARGLDGQLSKRARRRLEDAGLDLQRLPARASREQVLAWLAIAAEELEPGIDPALAHRRLGERLVRGFTGGWRTRAMLAAARAAGAERTLGRLVGRHNAPSNFLALEFTREGPGAYALELNLEAPHPELLVGLVEAALAELGAAGAEVHLAARGPQERLEIRLPKR